MTRLATLLCCFLAAASVEAREPFRAIYRVPAGPPVPTPWTLQPVLVLPTPLLALSDRDTIDGTSTAEFFARLTNLGFACVTREPPRRRLRRTEVFCGRGEEWFSYAGGWPKGGGVFVVDRIRVGREGSAALLGGAQVGAHLRGVLGSAEPQQVVSTQDTAIR